MKKAALTVVFISILLFSTGILAQLVNLAQANPYLHGREKDGEIPPPEGTLPPTILILSPVNNTVYASNNISVTLNVTMPESNNVSLHLSEIYYTASWEHEAMQLKKIPVNPGIVNLTDIPEGPRWIEVYAVATGFAYITRHEIEGIYYTTYYVDYKISSSASVKFSVDTTPPSILSCSVENKTYSTHNVPITLTINEPVSQVRYSLDGQRNVTATGNTTLLDLPNGDHNVIVYATDLAGHVGVSETFTFTVSTPEPTEPELSEIEPTETESTEPKPTEPEPELEPTETEPTEALPFTTTNLAITAAVTTAVILSVGMLVYYEKRKN